MTFLTPAPALISGIVSGDLISVHTVPGSAWLQRERQRRERIYSSGAGTRLTPRTAAEGTR